MKLVEHEGKKLFKQYDIATPQAFLLHPGQEAPRLFPCVLKAQVHTGDRFKHGGVLLPKREEEVGTALSNLFNTTIQGEPVTAVLVEEKVQALNEHYVSLSYSTELRGPVLSLAHTGGTGVHEANITPISILTGLDERTAHKALGLAGFGYKHLPELTILLTNLWRLFMDEYALLVEINPLFQTTDGFVAGDAKIILDDEKNPSTEKRVLEMDGDIAVLASGGGASMLNMDALIRYGGKPANYTEYSGNPKALVVQELTQRVLSRGGLKGCWVVGAYANFTDIQVTLSGFLDGLREITPKPTYPIVIRRDGLHRAEAFAMLEQAKAEGFDFHLYDSNTSMDESARTMVKLAYTP